MTDRLSEALRESRRVLEEVRAFLETYGDVALLDERLNLSPLELYLQEYRDHLEQRVLDGEDVGFVGWLV